HAEARAQGGADRARSGDPGGETPHSLPEAAIRRRRVQPARPPRRPAHRWPGRHRTGRYDDPDASRFPRVRRRVRQPRDRETLTVAIDRVTLELLRNHYQAVVEDM